jgi:hypothetical protein
MLQPIHFGVNSYKAKSGLISAERMLNCYAEITPQTSPFPNMVLGTAGLTVWKDTGVSLPVYGMRVMGENLYVVVGDKVYKIDSSKTVTLLGNITTEIGNVIMTDNGDQVTIQLPNGITYYCTPTASSLAQITDGDFNDSGSVTTLDGFTISALLNSNEFQWSDVNTTQNWNALNAATVEANSSKIVRVYQNNLELWFFKEDIIQVFYNTGSGSPLFQRKEGVYIEKGCASKYSIATMDNSFFFLGNDRIVYQTIGYQLKPISTFPISQEIETYTIIDDAIGFTYVQDGHKFYCLTFPSANKTWEYDITTELWHERESVNNSGVDGRWRANCQAYFAGKNLVGDFQTGIIYEIDPDVYKENETVIKREIIGTTMFKNFARMSLNKFVVMMDTGIGIATGQGVDPQLVGRFSDNGGKTYTDELWQSIGAEGSFLTEVFWTKIGGKARSFIARLNYSEPTKFQIVGAFVEVESEDD